MILLKDIIYILFVKKMQYGALRRKIGGTYKDFFKSYVEGIVIE